MALLAKTVELSWKENWEATASLSGMARSSAPVAILTRCHTCLVALLRRAGVPRLARPNAGPTSIGRSSRPGADTPDDGLRSACNRRCKTEQDVSGAAGACSVSSAAKKPCRPGGDATADPTDRLRILYCIVLRCR